MKYSKNKMLMVGDSLFSDIQGGNNAGIETCWFNRFKIENNSDIKPTYEIGELNELLNIIKFE